MNLQKNKTFIIADLHLYADRPDIYERFSHFIDHIYSPQSRQLFIIGDLFEYWVGDDAAEHMGFTAVIQKIRALTDNGHQVYFMRGNRDIMTGDAFLKQSGMILIDDPCLICIHNHNILLGHGDLLCADDKSYQRYRAFMQNSLFRRALTTLLPSKMRHKIAMKIRSTSKKKYKRVGLVDVKSSVVEKYVRDYRPDAFIHGHIHRPGIHNADVDDLKCTRYVLGDWFKYINYIEIDDKGIQLHDLITTPQQALESSPLSKKSE